MLVAFPLFLSALCQFAFCQGPDPIGQPLSIRFENKTRGPVTIWFRPADSEQYFDPPLQLQPGRSLPVNITGNGPYYLVLQQQGRTDKPLGWIDLLAFAKAYRNLGIQIESKVETRSRRVVDSQTGIPRVENYSVSILGINYVRYVTETRSQQQTYSVEVPYDELRHQSWGSGIEAPIGHQPPGPIAPPPPRNP